MADYWGWKPYVSVRERQRKAARETAKHAQRTVRQLQRSRVKAHQRDSLQALSKLGEMAGDQCRIVSQPPIVIPVRDLAPKLSPEELQIVWKLRRVLHALDSQQALELLLSKMKETKSNAEFLLQIQKTTAMPVD